MKVGFVYIKPRSATTADHQHEQGRKYMEEKLGDKVKIASSERAGRRRCERVIRNMAKGDYDLIFTTSFGYMNPTLKVAKQFPSHLRTRHRLQAGEERRHLPDPFL